MSREMKYFGSYQGNHLNRKLSHNARIKYFLSKALILIDLGLNNY